MTLLKDRTKRIKPPVVHFVPMVRLYLIGKLNRLRRFIQKPDGLAKSAVFSSTFNFNQSAQTGLFEVTDLDRHPLGRSGNFQYVGIYYSDLGQLVCCSKSLGGGLR